MNENRTTAGRIAVSIGERIITDSPLRRDHVAREFNSSHVPLREGFSTTGGSTSCRECSSSLRAGCSARHEFGEGDRGDACGARGGHVRNAAPKLSLVHLARIELALIEGDNAQTIEDFETAARAFHYALVAPCGLPRLLTRLDELQLANSQLVFAMARTAGWRRRSNQDHRLILPALRSRNLDQACNLLARHIRTIERLALQTS